MSTDLLALYGTSEPPAVETQLEAGNIRALCVGGALRNICFAGVEVIRGLHFLVRDRNWSTVVPVIDNLVFEQGDDAFSISFRAVGLTPSDNQKFEWVAHIAANAKEGLRFDVEGSADEDFKTCRTGFVVLHPLEKTAGSPVTLLHGDGRETHSVFPELVDPLQSFFDVVGMSHSPIPGVTATCRMEGGTWETEDHRNWLDASFKTYFRPLSLPWPYTIPKGQQVQQSVRLTFEGKVPHADTRPGATVVNLGDRTGATMPEVGLLIEVQDLSATQGVADDIAALGVQYLVFRLRSDAPDLPGLLRKAAQISSAAGTQSSLEIIVVERSEPDREIDLVAIAAASAGFRPTIVGVSPVMDLKGYPPSVDRPPGPQLEELYQAARRSFPDAILTGGTFSYFTELNRRHPPLHVLDMVQHATTSINHAADDRSVMETLETLPHIFRSVRSIAGSRPYRIGPANIGMLHNAYGDSLTQNSQSRRQTMTRNDPRHRAQFGAAWAAGFLARAVQSALHSVTIFSPAGDFGLLDLEILPPAACVIKEFAEMARGATLQSASSSPQSLLVAAAEKLGRRIALLTNLTPCDLVVQVSGWPIVEASQLSAKNGADFVPLSLKNTGEIILPPYAVARLRG